MTDTISRQAALDAIHCDITVTGRQNAELVAATIGAFADRIKALPPVQPKQEIIHCKDCRFWKKYKYFNGKPTYAPFCGFNSIFTDDNDFCSRAEKRGEADAENN